MSDVVTPSIQEQWAATQTEDQRRSAADFNNTMATYRAQVARAFEQAIPRPREISPELKELTDILAANPILTTTVLQWTKGLLGRVQAAMAKELELP